MHGEPPYRPPPTPWHTTYLSVTAISTGLLVWTLHVFTQLQTRLELVMLGIVVGMFTVTSVLHWYDVTGTERKT